MGLSVCAVAEPSLRRGLGDGQVDGSSGLEAVAASVWMVGEVGAEGHALGSHHYRINESSHCFTFYTSGQDSGLVVSTLHASFNILHFPFE